MLGIKGKRIACETPLPLPLPPTSSVLKKPKLELGNDLAESSNARNFSTLVLEEVLLVSHIGPWKKLKIEQDGCAFAESQSMTVLKALTIVPINTLSNPCRIDVQASADLEALERIQEDCVVQDCPMYCPYPSTTEEWARLGKHLSPEKFALLAEEVVLADKDLKEFVVAWKDICHDHSVFEVLKRMMEVHMPIDKKRKKGIRKCKVISTSGIIVKKPRLKEAALDLLQLVTSMSIAPSTLPSTSSQPGGIEARPSKARAQVPSIKEENLPSVAKNGLSIDEEKFGHMTSVDVVKCLMKAPMLLDLDEWSHWDRVFAPSLGPLLNFLGKEHNTSNLLCLVTRSGKMIRIDA
eukprot:Gb_14920 [translate_table: standard]